MKMIIVKNGGLQLILSPENEMETLALKDLNGAILTTAPDKIVVVDKTYQNAAILQKDKPSE